MSENKRDTSALPMYSMPGAFDGEPEPEDYEDAPEITEAMFEQGTWYDGDGRVIRKNGRPVTHDHDADHDHDQQGHDG